MVTNHRGIRVVQVVSRWRQGEAGFLPPLLVALGTGAAFAPALWNGFVEWDDHVNLLDNFGFRGFAWVNIQWMFTTVLMGHWIPVTWMTFALDFRLWGMNPFGYHLSSIVLHSLNAALFYLVALQLLRSAFTRIPERRLQLGAIASALFFALHPLRVESVAWATERRDVLSGFFFLAAILTYLQACHTDRLARRWRLAASLICYALAIGSKSIVVTLPVVLLILDVYPLRRLRGRPSAWWTPPMREVLAEKAPYLLLSALGALAGFYAQSVNHFFTSIDRLPLLSRIPVILYSLWFYLSRTAVPIALSPLHELPAHISLLDRRFALAAIVVCAVTGVVLGLRHRWPAGLAAWVSYAVLLFPVSGIVHSGYQLTHDRYSYLSCMPWAICFGGAIVALLQADARRYIRRPIVSASVGATALWLLALAVFSAQQVHAWRDTDTLWRYAIEADPTCSICHANLGNTLLRRGLIEPAIAQYEGALALRPDHVKFLGGLGLALLEGGRSPEAARHFQRLLDLHPDDQAARVNLAVALLRSGRLNAALTELERSIRERPTDAGAHGNLGGALLEAGRPREASEAFNRAIALRPDLIPPYVGRLKARVALGNLEGASQDYATLRRLDSKAANAVGPWLLTRW